MKKIYLLPALLFSFSVSAQEFEDNLFMTSHNSSLHLFNASTFTTMTAVAYRNSDKDGLVVETETEFKKGSIGEGKIRFTIKYTEHYILEDRKKSMGMYHISSGQLFDKYERTDYNLRNYRTYTFEHKFQYDQEVLLKEHLRTTEFLNEGAAEVDTNCTLDSTIFRVAKEGDLLKQYPLDDATVYTSYLIQDGKLMKKTNHFEGFDEVYTYTYDDKSRLTKLENNLKDEEGRSIYTYTEIKYDANGLMSEALFYDEKNALLEKTLFTYK
jgi:hypothetical protein